MLNIVKKAVMTTTKKQKGAASFKLAARYTPL